MECIRCSGNLVEPISIRSVKDIELCDACAHELTLVERQATAPLVVAAFAQFMSDLATTPPAEPCQDELARHFWASLKPFEEAVDLDDIAGALGVLFASAPSRADAFVQPLLETGSVAWDDVRSP